MTTELSGPSVYVVLDCKLKNTFTFTWKKKQLKAECAHPVSKSESQCISTASYAWAILPCHAKMTLGDARTAFDLQVDMEKQQN
jgi:hypothetical protein